MEERPILKYALLNFLERQFKKFPERGKKKGSSIMEGESD